MTQYYLNLSILCIIFCITIIIIMHTIYEQMYECFDENEFNKNNVVYWGYSYAPIDASYKNNILDMEELNTKVQKKEEPSIDAITTIDDTGRYVFP